MQSRVYGCAADLPSCTMKQSPSAHEHQLQCSLLAVFLLLPSLLLLIMIITPSSGKGDAEGLLSDAWMQVFSAAKERILLLASI